MASTKTKNTTNPLDIPLLHDVFRTRGSDITTKKGELICRFKPFRIGRRSYVDLYRFAPSVDTHKGYVHYCLGELAYIGRQDTSLVISADSPRLATDYFADHFLVFTSISGYFLIKNGDFSITDRSIRLSGADTGRMGMPVITMSFGCLQNMFIYKGKSFEGAKDRFVSGEIRIVSFTEDEFQPLTSEQKKLPRKLLKPPALGFTLLENQWHRPAYICFRDRRNEYYIMGMDEGSYFCSLLPETDIIYMTCEEALRRLAPSPEAVRSQRQGEWFMVKVPKNLVPDITECAVFCEGNDGIVCLPVDNNRSNEHRWCGSYRVCPGGRIYVRNGYLGHEGHKSIVCEEPNKWYMLVHNTARRSVSVKGVD